MNFDLVRKIADIPVSTRCRALGVTEQGFYSYMRRRKYPGVRAQQDAVLTDALVTAHRVSRETYGTRRLRTALAHKELITSRRRISRINRALGMKVRQRKRFVKTTQSAHDSPIAQNLLDRQFYPDAANKVWVTDITYLRSGTHWIYLCSIVDCFSGRVVGHRISPAIDAQLVCDAMAMAGRNRRPGAGCIVHSDRGSQYASDAFRALLKRRKLSQSMSRKGNYWDGRYTAVAGSSFGRLRADIGAEFASDVETFNTVTEYLAIFYNYTRIHGRINNTPAAFEANFHHQISTNSS